MQRSQVLGKNYKMKQFTIIAVYLLIINVICIGQTPLPDSVLSPASLNYSNVSPVKKFFRGGNYREEWGTEVKMPVFDIRKVNGGFRIDKLGGGQQTKSLQLIDKNGEEWVLRTVDKDVSPALKNVFQKVLIKSLAQDQISASHPYAALVVSPLADAIGVLAPQPGLFYVPDDPALEPYRSIFANTVCFLEKRYATVNNTPTIDTEDLEELMAKNNDIHILDSYVLKARLLDMLVADWDRHGGQWKWATRTENNKKYYYPIPRDRDFAFFESEALLVKIGSLVTMKHLQGFNKTGKNLEKLNSKNSWFDHTFLTSLDENQWKEAISFIQTTLTDSVIANAVSSMPKEVYAISGEDIAHKLRTRRDNLMETALEYYQVLADAVSIMGSNRPEYFMLAQKDGKLEVKMYAYNNGQKGDLIYSRLFDEADTEIITLDGLGGNDHFEINENCSLPILLQVKGGEGSDVFDVKGKMKIKYLDKEESLNLVKE